MKPMYSTCNKQKGLTLVELMIAMALGLTLSAGALMMFVGNKQTANFQREFAAVQENGRFATDLLMRDIRGAGFSGCANATITDTTNPDPGSDEPFLNFERTVYGYNYNTGGAWFDNADNGNAYCAPDDEADYPSGYDQQDCLDGKVDPRISGLSSAGSDILMLSTVSASECRVTEHNGSQPNNNACACSRIKCLGPVSANVKVAGSCNIEEGQILMVSDCKDAAIFQVTNWNASNGVLVHNTGAGSPGNCTKRLGKLYAPHGSMMEVKQTIYFIANENGIPTLHRKVNWRDSEALIANVENFQVRYGEGADGVVTNYRTANNVTNWDNVYAVRIDLVIRSENDNVLQGIQTYRFDLNGDGTGENIIGDPLDASDSVPADGGTDDLRLRKVFSTTIGVRNRLS